MILWNNPLKIFNVLDKKEYIQKIIITFLSCKSPLSNHNYVLWNQLHKSW